MWWWIGKIVVWLISAVWIVYVMADVIRGKTPGLSGGALKEDAQALARLLQRAQSTV
jgi:hypothetical protein